MSDEALSGVESVSQTKAMEPTSSPEEHSGVEASVDQPSTVQGASFIWRAILFVLVCCLIALSKYIST